MIRIEVSGFSGEGKSEVINLINDALKANSKRVLVISENHETLGNQPGRFDCVITEQTVKKSGESGVDFDYLIGQTEASAYELAQDSGYVVRIVSRNRIPMVCTRDFRLDRINLSIMNNVVVSWTIG